MEQILVFLDKKEFLSKATLRNVHVSIFDKKHYIEAKSSTKNSF